MKAYGIPKVWNLECIEDAAHFARPSRFGNEADRNGIHRLKRNNKPVRRYWKRVARSEGKIDVFKLDILGY